MKRISVLIIAISFFIACVSQPPSAELSEIEINELMERWGQAIRTEDPDLYVTTYWDNAALEIIGPDGQSNMLHGLDEVLDHQLGYFERFDLSDYRLPEDREIIQKDDGTLMMIMRYGENRQEEFHFEEREGQWRIVFQAIALILSVDDASAERQQVPVESPLQALYDGDENGRLGPREIERYLTHFRNFMSEPHEVRTPIDEILDRDENGVIEPHELEVLRYFFFVEQLRRAYKYDPEFAEYLDVDENHHLSLAEIEIVPIMFFHDPRWRNPRSLEHPLDARIDRNGNQQLDQEELRSFMEQVFRRVAFMPVETGYGNITFGTVEEIHRWADIDERDGVSGAEFMDISFVVGELFKGDERVALNPVLQYFDRNKDGFLDHLEVNRSREFFIGRLLWTLPGGEFGDDMEISEEGTELFAEFLGRPDQDERRSVETPIDRFADENGDGILSEEEKVGFENEMFLRIASAWMESPESHDVWDVRTILDELADADGDGLVNPEENELLTIAMAEAHRVQSPIDTRLDVNNNGSVDEFEIIRARRAGMPGGNIEADEQDRGPYPVSTLIDEKLDLNDDGQVDEREIQVIVAFFERGARVQERTPPALIEMVDFNGNGSVEREELVLGRERYLLPHPLDPDSELDLRLDVNEDGFIDPDEIGIAAGVAETGPLSPILDRLEVGGWRPTDEAGETSETKDDVNDAVAVAKDDPEKTTGRFAAEFTKKLDQIQDKKLAVVGLNAATENIDSDTSKGVIIFIENAFVNVGKTSVVDRKNIEKLVEEQKFQLSGLTDETTAVEIGKLSGADIVVIGSISYVGKKYYLNIKLILVETGEIIGSSISEAIDQTEFLEMTNEAVYKLF